MDTTRRSVLGAAMAAPLLAQFTGAASAADDSLGTVTEGWLEIRWTAEGQALLDRFQATVEAVAPAKPVKDAQGTGLRFPLATGQGDPSLPNPPKAHGNGRLDGGVQLRAPQGTLKVTELQGLLQDGLASGTCKVNGVEVGHRAMARPNLDKGVLQAENVPLGKPMKLRVTEVPLRPSAELVDTFNGTFGADAKVTTETVLAHATAEGVYTPPKKK